MKLIGNIFAIEGTNMLCGFKNSLKPININNKKNKNT